MSVYVYTFPTGTTAIMGVKQDLLNDLEASASRLESKISRYRESPDDIADELLARVESDLEKTEYHDTPDGDRCMHDHLMYLKRAYEIEPSLIVEYQADALNQKLQDMRNTIERMEA